MKKIYYNGTIITMELERYTQAVLTEDEWTIATGGLEELQGLASNAILIDLQGKTMLPAFIDAHGHLSSYANAQLQIPLEEALSFDEIASKITCFIESRVLKPHEWIVAKGYDHNALAEKHHPHKTMLDRISPTNPLVLQHSSGHCGVFNSAALAFLGVTPSTPSPAGGVIEQQGGQLTGYMEEEAYIESLKKLPLLDFEALLGAYGKAQEKYFSYGITTVQEGMMVAEMLPIYQQLLSQNMLTVDVVGYAEMKAMGAFASAFPRSLKRYDRHFKIGGYKIILDGSPQVKTAWMKTPYADSGDYCGYGTMSNEAVATAVKRSAEEACQLLAHCNGDAAAQQFIDAVGQSAADGEAITQLRPVLIHAQLIGTEQLGAVARLKMIPSFFAAHVLHWGDIHIANFGLQRAASISPANSALKHSIIFTFHQDAPVIEPNMLETVQCAVTRTTKSGIVLGEDEQIDVWEALKAITVNAAYQYFEEDSKGSIRAGKRADFVILSDNPMTVPHDEISAIAILETIKDGETVFCKG